MVAVVVAMAVVRGVGSCPCPISAAWRGQVWSQDGSFALRDKFHGD